MRGAREFDDVRLEVGVEESLRSSGDLCPIRVCIENAPDQAIAGMEEARDALFSLRIPATNLPAVKGCSAPVWWQRELWLWLYVSDLFDWAPEMAGVLVDTVRVALARRHAKATIAVPNAYPLPTPDLHMNSTLHVIDRPVSD